MAAAPLPPQELKTALEEKTKKPANNWWCISGGSNALAAGFLSVAVGDDAEAKGEMSLAVSEKLTVPQLDNESLSFALSKLFFIREIHLRLENRGHVKQIDRLSLALIARAQQAFRDGQRAEHQQSPETPTPGGPTETHQPDAVPVDASAQKTPTSPDACADIPFQQIQSRRRRNKSRPQASHSK